MKKQIMRRFAIMTIGLLLYLNMAMTTRANCDACLPKGLKETSIVSTAIIQTAQGKLIKKITVKEKLLELKAKCKGKKLVDAKGREVYFYQLKGCWGFPPPGYLEILKRQQDQLEKLRTRYTVIEITCNPSGAPIA